LAKQRNSDEIITVQGILFDEEEYIRFMDMHNFYHVTIGLLLSQLNGDAEGNVQSAKHILRQANVKCSAIEQLPYVTHSA